MWVHWCVKSYMIKAGKCLQQWTVPVHLIKSTCTRERWEMESKANRGAAARSPGFSLDANQRLDLWAGQASGTSLCLADLGNLLLIIPALTPHPLEPGNPSHLICTTTETNKHSPPKVYVSAGNNRIMTTEFLHAPYYLVSFCGCNLGIIMITEDKDAAFDCLKQ